MRYFILLIAGLLLSGASIYQLKSAINFIDHAQQAIGVVTDMVLDDDAYYPVFTIHTRQTGEVTYRHNAGSNPASWKVGEKATFLYDPAKPSDIRRKTYAYLFGWSITWIVIGIPLIIIGAGYFFLNPKRQFPKGAAI